MIDRFGWRLRDRGELPRDEPEPEREAGARLVDFLADARVLARGFDALLEAPERADVLEVVLLPDDRGGEPALELVLAFARDRGGEGTRVAMGQQPTRSSLPPHPSHAGS